MRHWRLHLPGAGAGCSGQMWHPGWHPGSWHTAVMGFGVPSAQTTPWSCDMWGEGWEPRWLLVAAEGKVKVPPASPDPSPHLVSFVPCGFEVPVLIRVTGQMRLPGQARLSPAVLLRSKPKTQPAALPEIASYVPLSFPVHGAESRSGPGEAGGGSLCCGSASPCWRAARSPCAGAAVWPVGDPGVALVEVPVSVSPRGPRVRCGAAWGSWHPRGSQTSLSPPRLCCLASASAGAPRAAGAFPVARTVAPGPRHGRAAAPAPAALALTEVSASSPREKTEQTAQPMELLAERIHYVAHLQRVLSIILLWN